MKINWIVRFKNPVWWVQLFMAILLPIIGYFGLTVENLTSWQILLNTLANAIQNPYVLGLVIVSVWNTLIDPTTKGLSDSERALNYTEPYKTTEQ